MRDLCGAVNHERAIRGILVTTSQFGSDARMFANENRITLIDGANPLYLLHEHGFAARIDMAEARQLGNRLAR